MLLTRSEFSIEVILNCLYFCLIICLLFEYSSEDFADSFFYKK